MRPETSMVRSTGPLAGRNIQEASGETLPTCVRFDTERTPRSGRNLRRGYLPSKKLLGDGRAAEVGTGPT